MAEHTLSSRHLGKCGHAGCECFVDPGDGYCSEQCEHADSKGEHNPELQTAACACGHPECKSA